MLTYWILKQYPAFWCVQETYLNNKDRHYLSVRDRKRSSKQMVPEILAGVDILISNKIVFQPKVIKCDDSYSPSYSSREKSTKRKSQF